MFSVAVEPHSPTYPDVVCRRADADAATITHQADTGRFRDSERTDAVVYLRRKAPYLDYATALAQGWQIATGITSKAPTTSSPPRPPTGAGPSN